MGAVAAILASQISYSTKFIKGLIIDTPYFNLKDFFASLVRSHIKLPNMIQEMLY